MWYYISFIVIVLLVSLLGGLVSFIADLLPETINSVIYKWCFIIATPLIAAGAFWLNDYFLNEKSFPTPYRSLKSWAKGFVQVLLVLCFLVILEAQEEPISNVVTGIIENKGPWLVVCVTFVAVFFALVFIGAIAVLAKLASKLHFRPWATIAKYKSFLNNDTKKYCKRKDKIYSKFQRPELIIALSKLEPCENDQDKFILRNGRKPLNLDEVIEAFKAVIENKKGIESCIIGGNNNTDSDDPAIGYWENIPDPLSQCAWLQPLRAIEAHLFVPGSTPENPRVQLKRIHVLMSQESKAQFESFRKIVEAWLSSLEGSNDNNKIKINLCAYFCGDEGGDEGGEAFPPEKVRQRIREIINADSKYGIKYYFREIIGRPDSGQFCIDVTGGTKPVVIGALSAALEGDAVVSYVESGSSVDGNTGRKIWFYTDLRAETPNTI